MKNLIILLAVVPFLFGASCKKAEKLTPETQTGANTFSCKINGKVYKTKDNLFSPGIVGGLAGRPENYSFFVEAVMYNGEKADYTLSMRIAPNISTLGKYNISSGDLVYHNGNDIIYNQNSGIINLTYIDFAQNITSGNFSFSAVNSSIPNDVITVTEGRFDIKN